MTELRLSAFVRASRVNGPGRRVVVWVRGCDLACPGCFNPGTHDPDGTPESSRSVAERILDARTPLTSGVTFSGGEPFQQAEGLAECATYVRAAWPDASLMAFSGYTLETLRAAEAPRGSAALLSRLDLLVDGPYDPNRPGVSPWRGSANQRVWVLGRAPTSWAAEGDAEIHVDSGGGVLLSGFPDPRLRRALARLE